MYQAVTANETAVFTVHCVKLQQLDNGIYQAQVKSCGHLSYATEIFEIN